MLDVRATSPAVLLAAVRAADPGGRYAMAVLGLPGSNQSTRGLAVDATRADAVLDFAGRSPGPVAGVLRPKVPEPLRLRSGVVEVAATVRSVDSESPLELSATIETPAGWQELDLGTLRPGSHTYRGAVPAACAPGCRLVGLAVSHPGAGIVTGRAALSFTALSAGPRGSVRPVAAGFDVPGAWRPGQALAATATAALRPGASGGLDADVTTPVGFPARIVHGDAPFPLPAVRAAQTPVRDGSIAVTGPDGSLTRVREAQVADFVPGIGRAGVVIDLELALRGVEHAPSDQLQVWLGRDDPVAEGALRAALARAAVVPTERHTSAQALHLLDREGAVLALLLFLACSAVAVVVAVGALLVAAFVGSRQRAAEVAALRAVGVRRRVLRRALLVENLAGVVVALALAVLAAVVAVVVVLPVLPLADEESAVLTLHTAPDLVAGAWSVLAVAALLTVLAVLVALAQLRGGSVDRMREGAR